MTTKVEHSDIGKHPEVIKRAQQDLLKMDVLVCGGCHSTYHFVKDFEEHKENCSGIQSKDRSDIKENWAFQLWKAAQPKNGSSEWKLYKDWATLSKPQQAAWISAGQTVQSISRLGQGAVQEAQVRVVRTVPDYKVPVKAAADLATPSRMRIMIDPSAEAKKKEESVAEPAPKRYMVKRTMSTTPNRIEVRELPAERVMSRRLNPKRNMYEYMVKWVGSFETTWEPKNHFDKATELIDECDRKLVLAKMAATQSPKVATAAAVASPVTIAARPIRTSKARAMDQVKQWCNTTEDKAAALAAELKRKNTDSDYAEAEDSSQDESMGGSPTPRKQMKTSPQVIPKVVGGQVRYYQKSVNGVLTNSSSPITANSAEVVIATSAEKTTGITRKPGMTNSKSPTKREAQVKVVGRNETTSSGIVRLSAGSAGTSPITSPTTVASPPAPGPRMQKVIQTTRLPDGQTVRRTVYRPIPPTPPAATPTRATVGSPRVVLQASPTRQYQARRGAAAVPTAQPVHKVSPGSNRLVRAPVAKPLGTARTVRSSPAVVPTAVAKVTAATKPSSGNASDSSSGELTLCPVTGKLISKTDAEAADNSELERLLTEAAEEKKKAEGEAQQEQQQQATGTDTQIQQLIENEDGSPVMITGDDGTIYQVAGKNAEGQTLLIAQGAEGEQQCVFVAAEEGGEETATATGEGVTSGAGDATSAAASQDGESGEDAQAMLTDQDSQDGQITAQLVEADEPSADGIRRVVLLLPDGTLMVSEVNEEQYQQFNLGA